MNRDLRINQTLAKPTYFNQFKDVQRTTNSAVHKQQIQEYIPSTVNLTNQPQIIKTQTKDIEKPKINFKDRIVDTQAKVQIDIATNFKDPLSLIQQKKNSETFQPTDLEQLKTRTLKDGQFQLSTVTGRYDYGEFSREDRTLKTTKNNMNATTKRNAESTIIQGRRDEDEKRMKSYEQKLEAIKYQRDKYMNDVLEDEKTRKF